MYVCCPVKMASCIELTKEPVIIALKKYLEHGSKSADKRSLPLGMQVFWVCSK